MKKSIERIGLFEVRVHIDRNHCPPAIAFLSGRIALVGSAVSSMEGDDQSIADKAGKEKPAKPTVSIVPQLRAIDFGDVPVGDSGGPVTVSVTNQSTTTSGGGLCAGEFR